MKKSLYLALILSSSLMACSNHVQEWEPDGPLPSAETEEVNLALQLVTPSTATRDGVGELEEIRDGYVLIALQAPSDLVLVKRIYFTQDQLDAQGMLQLHTRMIPSRYLLFVVANPTDLIKAKIEKSEKPWELEVGIKDGNANAPSFEGLEYVMTNSTKDYPFLGTGLFKNQLHIKPNGKTTTNTIVVDLKHIVSKISMKKDPVVFGENIANEVEDFEIESFLIINYAASSYLWEHWSTLGGNKENWVLRSPYLGEYRSDAYFFPFYKSVNWFRSTGVIHYLNGIRNQTHRKFSSQTQYVTENSSIICDENGNYLARNWCSTAIIIRVKRKNEGVFYSSLDDGKWIIKTSYAGWKDYVDYPGNMYFTYFIKDPDSSIQLDNVHQSYPSVFRNKHYTIRTPVFNRLGVDRPGRDMAFIKGDVENKNIWNEPTNTTDTRGGMLSTEIPEDYFLELEIEE